MNNNDKYEKVRPVAIALRMRYPEWTSRQILEELARMGCDPLPVQNTIGVWCQRAGIPFPRYGNKRRIPIDVERRALRMKIAGMSTPEVRSVLEGEGIRAPSNFFINRIYRDWRRDNGWIANAKTPEGIVENMIHAGMIELGQAWEELTQRGVSDEKALRWVMNKFTGPSAPCEFASSGCRTFSMHERRWAA